MPLDPQMQAFLEQANSGATASFGTVSVEEARQSEYDFVELCGPAEPVAKVEDRQIPVDGGEIGLRVYTPEGRAPFPALVYFHGGGWVAGDLETMDRPCRSLANGGGCVVVAVDYRRAPEHRYPVAAEDSYAATQWVAEHARALGIDPSRIAVGGDSAGGNLTAVVSQMARDRGGPPLAFQLLIYPVIDHAFDTPSYRENAQGYLLTPEMMQWFWNHYLAGPEDGRQPYASPIRAATLAGLPPALVQTAGYDPLRDEGEAYAAKLRAAGVPAEVHRYDGLVHGYLQMGALVDQARQATRDAGAALRTAFAR